MKIDMDTNQLRTAGRLLGNLSDDLNRIYIPSGYGPGGVYMGGESVRSVLSKCKSSLRKVACDTRAADQGVRRAATLLEDCEKTQVKLMNGDADASLEKTPNWGADVLGALNKVFGSISDQTKIASGLIDIVYGHIDDNSSKIHKGLLTVGQGAAKWFGKTMDWIPSLDPPINNALDSALDKFKYNFNKFKYNINPTTFGGAVNWVKELLSSGIDNYNDYKSGKIATADRAVVETVAEAGAKIAIGALACWALSPIAAPAVVITIAGSAIVNIADVCCKWATGKTMAQHVGEWAGNAYDSISPVLKEGAKQVKAVVTSAGDAVCNWFGNIFGRNRGGVFA